MKIIDNLLSYNNLLKVRDLSSIDIIVFHCTELPTLADARKEGEKIIPGRKEKCGNSGHYYIDRDGQIYRFIEDNRIAYHVISHNDHSIGIEIVNIGRYPDWYSTKNQIPTEEYTKAQIDSTVELLAFLKKKIPSLKTIKQHFELDNQMVISSDKPNIKVSRKIDPGPLFPWAKIVNVWQELLKIS
ncbi:MAG: N-acetyl-anhydromuranmyl-L-alanine amidase [Candidatus Scalindua rubra]|uniref:N-acetylmuramoyl-L-alanine amidase n=1 Tax=Candidatus Scalindua rubra TaxID=1872076 RepID=A0A1E3X8D1_9BACT|nr:MAG: N-acetyl-anhydromuranmyl-L-alanine amidase [Candidatus Scalindua rubra]